MTGYIIKYCCTMVSLAYGTAGVLVVYAEFEDEFRYIALAMFGMMLGTMWSITGMFRASLAMRRWMDSRTKARLSAPRADP